MTTSESGDRCPACGDVLPPTGIGCESCGWMGEPMPGEAVRAQVAPEHADGCAYYFADAADAESLCNCRGTARVAVEPGKPLPREPPAPTGDPGAELAELLGGIDDDIEMVTELRYQRQRSSPIQRVARTCKLLLREREQLTREAPRPSPDRAAWLLHPVSATGRQTIAASQYEELRAEAVALRARVAELEEERARMADVIRGATALRNVLGDRAHAAERRVAELTSAHAALVELHEREPEPGGARVAGLLDTLSNAARNLKSASDRGGPAYEVGSYDAYVTAARLVREHLGAPTPLDLAVGEVCAMLPREYPHEDPLPIGYVRRVRAKLGVVGASILEGDHDGARVQTIDAIADLLAGMLACDAPVLVCRICSSDIGTRHTPTCALRWQTSEFDFIVTAATCDAADGGKERA